ncbi:MAG: carboxypeptidase regulatory-like domain-containing protein [Flavobacteriales bacterium]|nr:carboxypeptidase regulatory-like domain-containing protein [Flavobacteriales bacterium]
MMRTFFLLLITTSCWAAAAQDTLKVQVHGSVLNANTESPVLEALVEWYDTSGHRQAVNQTNNEGHYAFFVLTTGQLELRVVENGYEAFSEKLTIEPGVSAKEFTIRLVPK